MRRPTKFILFLVIVTASFFAYRYDPESELLTAEKESAEKVCEVAYKYLKRTVNKPSAWLIVDRCDEGSDAYKIMMERMKESNELLTRYAHVDPLAGKIRAYFQTLEPILLRGGNLYGRSLGKIKPRPGNAHICFIPHIETQQRKFRASRYWDPQIGAIMVYAKNWPITVWAGVLFHELGHGLYDMAENAPSSKIHPATQKEHDLYASEEVTMHELQQKIYNALTDGRYFAKTLEIAKRLPQATSTAKALGEMTPDDFAELDALLGCPPDHNLNLSTAADNTYAMGFAYIDLQGGPAKRRLARKIAFYRAIEERQE